MKNKTIYTMSLLSISSFIVFQNFTNSYKTLDLKKHPAYKNFPLSDLDFNAPIPKNAPTCNMSYSPELGDTKFVLPENKELFSLSYGNNLSKTHPRIIKLEPNGCVYKGAIEIQADNVELDCNNAYIDGSDIPAFYPTSTGDKKSSRSGILVGKRYYYKTVDNNKNYENILIDYELASLLKYNNDYVGFFSEDQKKRGYFVNPEELIKYSLGANDFTKNAIKDRISTKDVKIKNCRIRNFPSSGIVVAWRIPDDDKVKFVKSLKERSTYAPKNIIIENNLIKKSGNAAVYIDDHVHDSFIVGNSLISSTGPGIYLEYHSNKNIVQNNKIFKNGYFFNPKNEYATRVREGIAIDGSFGNIIENNHFWDNGIGGIYLYKNCGEGGASNDPGVAKRERGADYNIIRNNNFYREQVGVWVASRQDYDLKRLRCSDDSPYPEFATYINQEGETVGPYRRYFLDFAKYNLIQKNNFVDNAIGVKIADDHNTVEANTFKGSFATLITVGLKNRFDYLKKPVEQTKIANNISYVTPVDNYKLYHIYGHPSNLEFSSNIQSGKKTCSPVVKNIKANNHPSLTCTFYLNRGDLSEGSISEIKDLTSSNTKGTTYGTAEFKCEGGVLKLVRNGCTYNK